MACNLLKGKKGIIFGALNEDSIAWKVAERAVEEGAEIVLTNTPISIRMGTIDRLAEKCGAIVVPADATSVADLENLIDRAMEQNFVPVVDDQQNFIGIITRREIISYCYKHMERGIKSIKKISKPIDTMKNR